MRTKGAHTLVAQRRPTARDRAWQSMRILRNFTAADVIATAEIGGANASRYINGLLRAGYLAIARPKRNGSKGGHAIYRLVSNTGPHAPRLQTGGNTYDPNTGKTHE